MKNHILSIVVAFTVIFTILTICGCKDKNDKPQNISAEQFEQAIENRLAAMSLHEKVGMVFMVRPESFQYKTIPLENINDAYEYGTNVVTSEMKNCYRQYPAGGVCLFAKNVDNPKQLRKMIKDFRSLNPDILFSVDEEGGRIARLANNDKFKLPKFDSMETLAKGLNGDEVYPIAKNVGLTIGKYLSDLGFDIDFAPVADVNTNPDNIIIGDRAFGDNPVIVGSAVSGVIAGLNEAGIVGCLKHFPGHGDTTGDTHVGYVQSLKTWDEMMNCEMIPFRAGIENGAKMVMTAHITVPNVTDDELPSTLSSLILQEKLRGELGFSGVIVSDAMAMGAIHNNYSSGESAVNAFLAGCDILLMPYDYIEAYQAMLDAVKNGTITEDRLNDSVRRILSLKK